MGDIIALPKHTHVPLKFLPRRRGKHGLRGSQGQTEAQVHQSLLQRASEFVGPLYRAWFRCLGYLLQCGRLLLHPEKVECEVFIQLGQWLPQSHIDGVLLAPPPSIAPSQSGPSWTLEPAHPWGSAWSCNPSWLLGIQPYSPGSSQGSLSSPCLSGRGLLCTLAGVLASQINWEHSPTQARE